MESRNRLFDSQFSSRSLASMGHHPAIDVRQSVSRVMNRVVSESHRDAARSVRELVSIHEEKRDLVTLGAYREGTDPSVDRALRARADIQSFLRQSADEVSTFESTLDGLRRIASRHG